MQEVRLYDLVIELAFVNYATIYLTPGFATAKSFVR